MSLDQRVSSDSPVCPSKLLPSYKQLNLSVDACIFMGKINDEWPRSFLVSYGSSIGPYSALNTNRSNIVNFISSNGPSADLSLILLLRKRCVSPDHKISFNSPIDPSRACGCLATHRLADRYERCALSYMMMVARVLRSSRSDSVILCS